MFTTNACRYLNKYKMISFDPDQSQLDEQAGYVVGVIGLYYQVRHTICVHIYEITGTHKHVYMDQFMTIAHYSLFFFLLTFFLELPCETKKNSFSTELPSFSPLFCSRSLSVNGLSSSSCHSLKHVRKEMKKEMCILRGVSFLCCDRRARSLYLTTLICQVLYIHRRGT
jgi:hypothetical protein